jgi:hypothetical protein
LFTLIIDGEVLLPLTEGDRTASLLDKVEMALLERSLSLLPRTGQQQASLPPPKEALILFNMVAKAVYIIYEMSRR